MINKPTTEDKTAAIYIRVSTAEQVKNHSLATQEKGCREFCDRMGWKVTDVFREEGESAKTADRTKLKKLLSICTEKKKNGLAPIPRTRIRADLV